MQYLGKTGRERCLFVIALILLASLFFLVGPLGSSKVMAQDPLEGLEQVGEQAGLKGETTDLYVLIGRVVSIALSLMGLILVILLVIAGIMWMTSHGNEEQLQKAKTMIRNALIGLAIVVIAYALAYFVIGRMEGVVK